MAAYVVITGGDPTNPRRPADLVARLAQIERDADAMSREAARLHLFLDILRPGLRDSGMTERKAMAAMRAIGEQVDYVREKLYFAGSTARLAKDQISALPINLNRRYEWEPNSGR